MRDQEAGVRVSVLLFVGILILAVPASSTITTPAPPIKAKGSDPLFRIQENGKWGYMDRFGVVTIEPRFDSAGDFFGGLAIASRDGVAGYIDTFGNWRIRTQTPLRSPRRKDD
jgi:hypothetical protein